jgi:outer membrane protein
MNYFKKSAITGLFIICSGLFTLNAQNYKFGHINTQTLLEQMPESDTARAKFQQAQRQLQQQLEEMQVELNRKYQNYQNQKDTIPELLRQTKETEIMDMQQRIQEFQMSAQEDVQKRKTELFQPIYKKMDKAIKEVADKNGFTYVFDVSIGSVLYHSDKSVDILPLVKKELGIE